MLDTLSEFIKIYPFLEGNANIDRNRCFEIKKHGKATATEARRLVKAFKELGKKLNNVNEADFTKPQ